jgi:hypothetical protein
LKRNYSKNNYDYSENRNKFSNLFGKTSNEEKITNCSRATNPKVYNSFNFRDLANGTESAQPKRREKRYVDHLVIYWLKIIFLFI